MSTGETTEGATIRLEGGPTIMGRGESCRFRLLNDGFSWHRNVRELEQLARQLLVLHGLQPVLRRVHRGRASERFATLVAGYQIEHERIGRRFALKVLRGSFCKEGLERFRRESDAIARLESEYTELADGTYFVMAWLRGQDRENHYGR